MPRSSVAGEGNYLLLYVGGPNRYGYPTAEAETLERENGYRDCLMDTGELFASWIIEGPETLKQELPAAQAGLPVRFTYDHRPYRERKVRILNGAHTLMAPGAFLAGQKIVRECMQEPVIRAFLDRAVYDEILPTLSLPEEECRDFAAAVIERFQIVYRPLSSGDLSEFHLKMADTAAAVAGGLS